MRPDEPPSASDLIAIPVRRIVRAEAASPAVCAPRRRYPAVLCPSGGADLEAGMTWIELAAARLENELLQFRRGGPAPGGRRVLAGYRVPGPGGEPLGKILAVTPCLRRTRRRTGRVQD